MRVYYLLPSLLLLACGDDGMVRQLPDAPTDSECPCEYLQACVENTCVDRGGLAAAVVRRGTSINSISACVMQTRPMPPTVQPIMSKDGCDAYSYPSSTDTAHWGTGQRRQHRHGDGRPAS